MPNLLLIAFSLLLLACPSLSFGATLGGDIRFSASQIRQIAKAFPEADLDHDGTLNENEAMQMVEAYVAANPEADADADGSIDFMELLRHRGKARRSGAPPVTVDDSPRTTPVGEGSGVGGKAAAPGANPLAPTLTQVKYDRSMMSHFNFWKVEGATPAPCLVILHGGGFTSGRPEIDAATITACTQRGVALVALEYVRLQEQNDLLLVLTSIARSLQFLRAHAVELNLDPTRIACAGTSTGAGAALWLATHDDLAKPESEDPVLRQSSRPTAVRVTNTQATFNFFRWPEVLGKADAHLTSHIKYCYGSTDIAALKADPAVMAHAAQLDMLALIDANDASIFLEAQAVDEKSAVRDITHDLRHARAVFAAAQAVGLECVHRGYTPDAGDGLTWLFGKLGVQ
jgi:hypothetical protein